MSLCLDGGLSAEEVAIMSVLYVYASVHKKGSVIL